MATTIKSTALDFTQIKGSLTSYLQKQSEFADYNFEGSALSALTGVMAYNTHINGLIANFALNESFLNTAQLRSSVVNIAAGLGYTPRSATSAKARVTCRVNLSLIANKPNTITLPEGSLFETKVDNNVYYFRTTQEYIGYDLDGLGIYTFVDEDNAPSIEIVEGGLKTKTFIVDAQSDNSQVYVLPDDSIDLASIQVRVYDDINSDTFTTYTNINSLSNINEGSTFYYVNETYNGYYELNFGVEETLGKSPEPGNVIRVTYISPNGSVANNASSFTTSETISYGGSNYLVSVTTSQAATLGADKEPIENIRINAPVSYAAQRRLVTPQDYIGIISNSVQGIKSVNAWGGEDHKPARYGQVILSIIYDSTVTASEKITLQQKIRDEVTDNFSIISIRPYFVDPEYTYLDVTAQVAFNPKRTDLTRRKIESNLRSTIRNYFDENLGDFNDIFRKSNLLTVIDESDPSILSSIMDVKMVKNLVPSLVDPTTVLNVYRDYTINYLSPIAEPDGKNYKIVSDVFIYNGISSILYNKIDSNVLQIVGLDGTIVVNNIGNYDPTTGTIYLYAFFPDGILSGNDYIRIAATPSNDLSIKPLRNSVISLGNIGVSAIEDDNSPNSVLSYTSIRSNLSTTTGIPNAVTAG